MSDDDANTSPHPSPPFPSNTNIGHIMPAGADNGCCNIFTVHYCTVYKFNQKSSSSSTVIFT